MRKKQVWGLVIVGVIFALLFGTNGMELWSQNEAPVKAGKNLQVLEFTSLVDLQNFMKGITEALGVQCKFCHDLRDFSRDLPELHKLKAREMMKMAKEINEKFFKEHPDEQLTCYVCHRGRETPVFSKQQWDEIQKKESGQQ